MVILPDCLSGDLSSILSIPAIMSEFICRYCGRVCKNQNSLTQHEIRCKSNPNRLICFGNKGNIPKHYQPYYNTPYKLYKPNVELDITKYELDKYMESHKCCEICGKTIEECVKWESKHAPKKLCIDHDHKTNKFRGLLCSVCNRQLGWYEKYVNEINNYLNKT